MQMSEKVTKLHFLEDSGGVDSTPKNLKAISHRALSYQKLKNALQVHTTFAGCEIVQLGRRWWRVQAGKLQDELWSCEQMPDDKSFGDEIRV
jgi:hypothetical protein